MKVRPGKATLSVLTNESDDVALYSYVSRDKTITPINFYNFLEKSEKIPSELHTIFRSYLIRDTSIKKIFLYNDIRSWEHVESVV